MLLSTILSPSVVTLSASTFALTVKFPVMDPLPVPVNALIEEELVSLICRVSVVALPIGELSNLGQSKRNVARNNHHVETL